MFSAQLSGYHYTLPYVNNNQTLIIYYSGRSGGVKVNSGAGLYAYEENTSDLNSSEVGSLH